ncbi:unnamed protein product, partial [Phaeothamnion confervicola]
MRSDMILASCLLALLRRLPLPICLQPASLRDLALSTSSFRCPSLPPFDFRAIFSLDSARPRPAAPDPISGFGFPPRTQALDDDEVYRKYLKEVGQSGRGTGRVMYLARIARHLREGDYDGDDGEERLLADVDRIIANCHKWNGAREKISVSARRLGVAFRRLVRQWAD